MGTPTRKRVIGRAVYSVPGRGSGNVAFNERIVIVIAYGVIHRRIYLEIFVETVKSITVTAGNEEIADLVAECKDNGLHPGSAQRVDGAVDVRHIKLPEAPHVVATVGNLRVGNSNYRQGALARQLFKHKISHRSIGADGLPEARAVSETCCRFIPIRSGYKHISQVERSGQRVGSGGIGGCKGVPVGHIYAGERSTGRIDHGSGHHVLRQDRDGKR